MTNVSANQLNYDAYTSEKYDKEIIQAIPFHKYMHFQIAFFIEQNFDPQKHYRILDLGVETGITSAMIKKILPLAQFDVVDFSKNMLIHAKIKLGEDRVNYIYEDYIHTKFETGTYDIIISVIGLHHQNEKGTKIMFQKMYYALKPGGSVLLGDLMTHQDKKMAAQNQAKHFHHLVEQSEDDIMLADWSYHHLHLNDLKPREDLVAWMKQAGLHTTTMFHNINTGLLIGQKIYTPSHDTSKLFSKDIQEFLVPTKKLGTVRYVNFDNAATTPPLISVEQATKTFLSHYGSVHRGSGTKSQLSTDVYEKSRHTIKQCVHAPDDSYVIFSQNTTGGINMLAHFFALLPGKIAISSIEHSSSMLPWIVAEGYKKYGRKKERPIPNDLIQKLGNTSILTYDIDDRLEFDLSEIEGILAHHHIKALVVTASSNVTGYCPDLSRLGQLCKKYDTYFVVDCCQYIPHKKIDMQKHNIDFIIASGHKFYAPYGGGFVIGPKDFFDQFMPYQIGGGNIDYIDPSKHFYWKKSNLVHDPGTPNALGAISMSAALQTLEKIGYKHIQEHEKKLIEKIYYCLKNNRDIIVYTKENHLNSIVTFNIKSMSPDQTARILNDDYGIGVRSGSFCMYRAIEKITNEKGVVRVSIGLCNTEENVERFISAIEDITK